MRAQVTTHMVCHDVIEQCLIKMFLRRHVST